MKTRGLVVVLLPLFLIVAWARAHGFTRPERDPKPYFDVRLPKSLADRGGFRLRLPTAEQQSLARAFESELPGLELSWDGMSGSPQWISAPGGRVLSAPTIAPREVAAREFLREHAELFGLTTQEVDALELSSVVPFEEGDAHVHFVQKSGALDVFQGGADLNYYGDGSLLSVGAHLYAGVRTAVDPALPAAEAVRIAAFDVYPQIPVVATVLTSQEEGDRRTLFDATGFARPPQARLVLFPVENESRLAWEVSIAEPTLYTDYLVLVDAVNGALLFRANRTVYATARYLQIGYPDPQTEEFAPAQYALSTIPASTPQSPSGWITPPGTSLTGNNAVSHMLYWTEPGLSNGSAAYDFPYNTTEAALVNAYWWVNDVHDRFYALGFDEPAGNFQANNFGHGGIAGDPVQVVAWTIGDRNNAFFTWSADGGVSTINFFWVDCRTCGDHDGYPENGGERDAGFMREVVAHEYTHGVSDRLVGGPTVSGCLGGVQSGGMGEAWSDLFAASFYGDPQIGQHFFEGPGWMRDLRNDLTYSDLCKVSDFGCEVHADGQIWAGTLWDLRRSMIELDPVNGLDQFQRIIVKGLANTVCHPTFLNARDGILNADATLYASAHQRIIWNVFAKRRMGNTASSTGENDTAPVTSTSVPAGLTCTAPAAPTGLTAAASGPNSIQLTYTATGVSAVEVYREELGSNTFDARVRIGSTTSTTTFIDNTAQGGKTYRYHVAALGSAGITCRSADSATADASTTGSCSAYPIFDPGLTVSDGAPSCTLTLSWSAAAQGCPSTTQPIVYNIYRADFPGFEPSDRLLIGRTTATSFQDEPPQDSFGKSAFYYLVLAQHGTLTDPPDHRSRGSSQVYKWVPRVPTLGRTTAQSWDFNAGASGWTVDNSASASGAWTLATSTPPTRLADAPFNPPTVPGGTGQAWFTGQGNSSVASNDCDGQDKLISPIFDATGGRTILSYDYWAHLPGNFRGGLIVQVYNGTSTVNFQDIGLMTAQSFDTATDRGWQHAEVDLAALLTPTATMRVTFISKPGDPLSEFAIDNVKVEQAAVCGRSSLRITGVTIDDTPPGWGNGNGKLEAGETARLRLTLTNDGTVAAAGTVGVMSPRSPGMVAHETQDSFPNIPAAGGTGTSIGAGFTVTAPASFACGSTLVLDFVFTDGASTVSQGSVSLEGGRTQTDVVFQDTFATDKGWTPGGTPGQGIWQRGDPVGTIDGGFQANPENDSPNDADSFCYVTENGPVGGAAGANDVDSPYPNYPYLDSPSFSLAGYKRAYLSYDVWYYDNSSAADFWQDYGEVQIYVNDGLINAYDYNDEGDRTGGWKSVSRQVSVPMVPNEHIFAYALDEDASWYSGATDSVVEMGLDNVKVTADKPVCDAATVIHPPNGIGATLFVTKSSQVNMGWTAPPVDAFHNAAAYYAVYVAPIPGSGFSPLIRPTLTSAARPLAGGTEFYLVSAVNQAGTSGDEPLP